MRVITFGTFDLFHIGHLNILRRARSYGDALIVGVSTDELNYSKKGFYPLFPLKDRMEIVRSIGFVTDVFEEESLDFKSDYIRRYQANILVMGHDWAGRFDHLGNLCKLIYLERTPDISTTILKERARHPL